MAENEVIESVLNCINGNVSVDVKHHVYLLFNGKNRVCLGCDSVSILCCSSAQ